MTDEQKPLLILGTRSFAEEIADVISEIPGIRIAGFVENLDRSRCKSKIGTHSVFWVDELAALAKTHQALCGLGTTLRHLYTAQAEKFDIDFATLVHPSAHVSTASTLAEGTFVSTGAIIAAHTHLGKHVIVNRGALIGHHTQIGPFVTLSPGANIAGNSRIGEGAYIGMSAAIIDNVTVGEHCVVAAGAVVTKNVPDRVMVAGVPAKIVKKNIDGK